MALGRQLSLGIASVEENCLAQVTVGVAHPMTDQHGVQVNSQPSIQRGPIVEGHPSSRALPRGHSKPLLRLISSSLGPLPSTGVESQSIPGH